MLHSMWDLPRPGIEPKSPTLVGRFFTMEPPGMPIDFFYHLFLNILSHIGLGAISRSISDQPSPASGSRQQGRVCWGTFIQRGPRTGENSKDVSAGDAPRCLQLCSCLRSAAVRGEKGSSPLGLTFSFHPGASLRNTSPPLPSVVSQDCSFGDLLLSSCI